MHSERFSKPKFAGFLFHCVPYHYYCPTVSIFWDLHQLESCNIVSKKLESCNNITCLRNNCTIMPLPCLASPSPLLKYTFQKDWQPESFFKVAFDSGWQNRYIQLRKSYITRSWFCHNPKAFLIRPSSLMIFNVNFKLIPTPTPHSYTGWFFFVGHPPKS